jgi:hypothetical protein
MALMDLQAGLKKRGIMTTFEVVREVICQGEGIDPKILIGTLKVRKRELVFTRQAIFYFMRELTKESLAQIGAYYSKDHATVLHACKVINDLAETDRSIGLKIKIYREKIRMGLEFEYSGSLSSIRTIRENIRYCINNGIEIPEDIVRYYNTIIKQGC